MSRVEVVLHLGCVFVLLDGMLATRLMTQTNNCTGPTHGPTMMQHDTKILPLDTPLPLSGVNLLMMVILVNNLC